MLGSLEYASAHFDPSALFVLGHERCGAVHSTVKLVKRKGKAPGSILAIVRAIEPAVVATRRGSLSQTEYIEAVIRRNAQMVARSIPGKSPILQSAVGAGKLRIVPALYSLATGKVTLLG